MVFFASFCQLIWEKNESLLGDPFASFFQRTTEHNLIARRNRNITATLVRKTFVSKAHSEKPELK